MRQFHPFVAKPFVLARWVLLAAVLTAFPAGTADSTELTKNSFSSSIQNPVIEVGFAEVQIRAAIELIFPTELGFRYTLQRSTNLVTWEEAQWEVTGTGNPVSEFFRIESPRPTFFRMRATRLTLELPDVFDGERVITMTAAGLQENIRLSIPARDKYLLSYNSTETAGLVSNIQRILNTVRFDVTPRSQTHTDTNLFTGMPGTVELNFISYGRGTFRIEPTTTNPITGTFIVSQRPTGQFSDLSARVLQLHYASGGERFSFISATTAIYEDDFTVATYTYDVFTGVVYIILASGWEYQITLAADNTATVVFKSSSTATPVTESAHYTLLF